MSRCINYQKEFHMFERRIDELEQRKRMIEDSLFNHHREYEMVANELCEIKKLYRQMMCDTDCYLGEDCKEDKKDCCKDKKEDSKKTITVTPSHPFIRENTQLLNNEINQYNDLAGRHYQPLRTE